MKPNTPFLRILPLPLLLVLVAPYTLSAAVFKKAEVTRVLNDVRVLPDQSNAAPARIGDVITGKTAVATGVSSRAELKFPDQTLTRLGANTLFRLEEGTRDIDLEKGVILFQVPKQLGGARVRTAAVTAAITGTTILVEYQPDGYIKFIVIEGELDLFMRDKPSQFITIKAGDMIVMKADAKSFPLPVQVDLERLIKTSKLLDPNEFGPIGNNKQITDALDQQGELKKDGELLNTAFMLPGRGTQVSLTNEVRREILRFQDAQPAGPTPSPKPDLAGNPQPGPVNPGPGPGPNNPEPRPFIPGTTYLTDNDPIVTNPHLTAYNTLANADVTSQGFFYRSSLDGQPGPAIFGTAPTPSPLDLLVNAAGLWAAFHFEDLVIVGNPTVNSITGARNLLLASDSDIQLLNTFRTTTPPGTPSGSGEIILDSGLDTFMLASNQGSIVLYGDFRLRGTNHTVLFQTYGPDADVRIEGDFYTTNIDLPDGSFHVAAGRDILFSAAGVSAASVQLDAKRDVTLTDATHIQAKNKIEIKAGRTVTITNSSQLRAMSYLDPLAVFVEAQTGDLSVIDSTIDADQITLQSQLAKLILTNSVISGDVIRARTMGQYGELLINGTTFNAMTALKLYAEGSNGHVRFTGNSTINSPSTDIAGKTVTIDPGVDVSVSNPGGLRVYTDNPNFSNNSANGFGRFTNSGTPFIVDQQGFGNRPGFHD